MAAASVACGGGRGGENGVAAAAATMLCLVTALSLRNSAHMTQHR